MNFKFTEIFSNECDTNLRAEFSSFIPGKFQVFPEVLIARRLQLSYDHSIVYYIKIRKRPIDTAHAIQVLITSSEKSIDIRSVYEILFYIRY